MSIVNRVVFFLRENFFRGKYPPGSHFVALNPL